ncbi:hypothetical protein SQ11_06505 [Nitrosospira sp. NpAV]|nr:hypothetical protein SQ11_06505 [Nitrosospira sp. NpAV]
MQTFGWRNKRNGSYSALRRQLNACLTMGSGFSLNPIAANFYPKGGRLVTQKKFLDRDTKPGNERSIAGFRFNA